MVDDEVTLTMVEDLYLSASEESVPAERSTLGNSPQNLAKVSLVDNAEQPFDHLPVPITPLPQPPDQLTSEQPLNHIPCPATPQALPPNVPSASGLSQQPGDESLTGNGSKVLVDLEKAFSELTSISNLEDLLELHSRMRVVVSVEKLMELKGTHCSVVVSGVVCSMSLQFSAEHIGA